jgi:DNA processing protein
VLLFKNQRERLIMLHNARGIGWKTIKKMSKLDPSFAQIMEMNVDDLVYYFKMKKQHAQLFFDDLNKVTYENLFNYYLNTKTHILTVLDPEYPPYLREIYDPPWVLYCQGNLQYLQSQNMISVVGTRDPSNYGIKSMNTLLPPLIDQGWIIVSGLAYGIDVHGHQLAINRQGKTIAVLGSGLECIYPNKHKPIANIIGREHLLISEYPNKQKPQRWQFPFRNRIISGLTRGTLVIEAKERSGSFITADQALNQGREVFAVPGSIFESRSYGTNTLIQQGAKLVMSPKDITDELKNFD